jgi:hypothetical protein
MPRHARSTCLAPGGFIFLPSHPNETDPSQLTSTAEGRWTRTSYRGSWEGQNVPNRLAAASAIVSANEHSAFVISVTGLAAPLRSWQGCTS